jgi:ammonia channel protein AmtB
MGAIVIGLDCRLRLPVGRERPQAMLGADDSLDVFGVHGVGGILPAHC